MIVKSLILTNNNLKIEVYLVSFTISSIKCIYLTIQWFFGHYNFQDISPSKRWKCETQVKNLTILGGYSLGQNFGAFHCYWYLTMHG